jgi:hypothetical protein
MEKDQNIILLYSASDLLTLFVYSRVVEDFCMDPNSDLWYTVLFVEAKISQKVMLLNTVFSKKFFINQNAQCKWKFTTF